MKYFNRISKVIIQPLVSALLLSLIGCGESVGVVSNTRIGRLIKDDSVNHLYYVTETHSGYISSEGEFVYEPGESIQFYNGNILIGKTKATDVITSFSLSDLTLSAE